MKGIHDYYPLLSRLAVVLILTGCQSKAKEKFTLKRSYFYTIKASIGGNMFIGSGPTRFELKHKMLRRMKFRHLPEKSDATMYAYRLTSQYEYNETLNKSEVVSGDTVEVAVTKSQADSLFNMAKAVFESVSVSNIDTLYAEPKMTTYQTDDASGTMSIESKYGSIQIDVGPLHSSANRQATSFLSLYNGFEALFSKNSKSE